MNASELARDLLAAVHDGHWSWVVAFALMLGVAGLRALPSSKLTAWTRTGLGALGLAVLASLTGGFATAWAAHGSPFTLATVMPALGVAAKAVALWEAQKRTVAAVRAPTTVAGTIVVQDKTEVK